MENYATCKRLSSTSAKMRGLVYLLCLLGTLIITAQTFCQDKYKHKSKPSFQSRYGHQIIQGFNMKLLMAPVGIIGKEVLYRAENYNEVIGLEYPEGSSVEHLYSGEIWIGALIDTMRDGNLITVKRVSTADNSEESIPYHYYDDYWAEMTPIDTAHPWHYLSTVNGDPEAISERDYICEYTDTIIPNNVRHY